MARRLYPRMHSSKAGYQGQTEAEARVVLVAVAMSLLDFRRYSRLGARAMAKSIITVFPFLLKKGATCILTAKNLRNEFSVCTSSGSKNSHNYGTICWHFEFKSNIRERFALRILFMGGVNKN